MNIVMKAIDGPQKRCIKNYAILLTSSHLGESHGEQ